MFRNRIIDEMSDNESLGTAYYEYPAKTTAKQDVLHNLSLISDYVKLLEDEKQDSQRFENNFADEKTEEFLHQSEELELKLRLTQARCRAIGKNLEFLRTLAENAATKEIFVSNESSTSSNSPIVNLNRIYQRAVPLKPPNQPAEEIIHVDDQVIHRVCRESAHISPAFVVTRLGNYQKMFLRQKKEKNECSSLSDIYKTAQEELSQLVKRINQLQRHVAVESDSQLVKALEFQLEYFKKEEKNKQRQLDRLRKYLQIDRPQTPPINQSSIPKKANYLTKEDLSWR